MVMSPAISMLRTALVGCWVGKPRFFACLVKPPLFLELVFSYLKWPLQVLVTPAGPGLSHSTSPRGPSAHANNQASVGAECVLSACTRSRVACGAKAHAREMQSLS